MTYTAAHLVDRVILKVPVRQWVFSLPYALRYQRVPLRLAVGIQRSRRTEHPGGRPQRPREALPLRCPPAHCGRPFDRVAGWPVESSDEDAMAKWNDACDLRAAGIYGASRRFSSRAPRKSHSLLRPVGTGCQVARFDCSGPPEDDSTTERCGCEEDQTAKKGPPRNYSWSRLMAGVFEFDVLKCIHCKGKVRILAAIHPTINTRKILECLESPSRAPPNARASSECTF